MEEGREGGEGEEQRREALEEVMAIDRGEEKRGEERREEV